MVGTDAKVLPEPGPRLDRSQAAVIRQPPCEKVGAANGQVAAVPPLGAGLAGTITASPPPRESEDETGLVLTAAAAGLRVAPGTPRRSRTVTRTTVAACVLDVEGRAAETAATGPPGDAVDATPRPPVSSITAAARRRTARVAAPAVPRRPFGLASPGARARPRRVGSRLTPGVARKAGNTVAPGTATAPVTLATLLLVPTVLRSVVRVPLRRVTVEQV